MLNFFLNYYLLSVIVKAGDNPSAHLKGMRWLTYNKEDSLDTDNKRSSRYIVQSGEKQAALQYI